VRVLYYFLLFYSFDKNLLFRFLIVFISYSLSIYIGVKAGGDRQELHEAIRVHSMDAGAVVKGEGKPNDLMERIRQDSLFDAVHAKLDGMIDPVLFVGRAPEQVDEFLREEIDPLLEANKDLLAVDCVDGVNV
jgi:adenylosuccinate lyase